MRVVSKLDQFLELNHLFQTEQQQTARTTLANMFAPKVYPSVCNLSFQERFGSQAFIYKMHQNFLQNFLQKQIFQS